MAESSPLQCVVVTPEMTLLDERADFVVLPLFDGELGVARLHAPMIGRLGYGELRIKQGDNVSRYFIEGGFAQVADDVVSVMTNRAMPVSAIDVHDARRQLDAALDRPSSGPDAAARERDIAQARGKIRVAEWAKAAR